MSCTAWGFVGGCSAVRGRSLPYGRNGQNRFASAKMSSNLTILGQFRACLWQYEGVTESRLRRAKPANTLRCIHGCSVRSWVQLASIWPPKDVFGFENQRFERKCGQIVRF
jgi:hypothetical protein